MKMATETVIVRWSSNVVAAADLDTTTVRPGPCPTMDGKVILIGTSQLYKGGRVMMSAGNKGSTQRRLRNIVPLEISTSRVREPLSF